MRKILVLVEEISEADYIGLAQDLAIVCEAYAKAKRCDILVIAGSLDPQECATPDPSAN